LHRGLAQTAIRGPEFAHREWLVENHCAEAGRSVAHACVAEGGHDDEWRVNLSRAEVFDDRQPVYDGQSHVRDDDVVGTRAQRVNPELPTIGDVIYLETIPPEGMRDERAQFAIVLSDERTVNRSIGRPLVHAVASNGSPRTSRA
jgi:hypothetical protein